jgi:two-component system, LytTR family, response regulator AlgR
MMKILIVDDEPLARERLRALVNEMGMGEVVGEAGNGKEALLMVRAHEPQVVLLDTRMPGMDGIEAAQQLTSLDQPPVVIFTTAYSEHALEAFEHQAIDYLLKPISKERLEQALKRAYAFIQGQLKSPPATPAARTHISYFKRGELCLLPVNKVYYFFAHQKYIIVYWEGGEVLITEALKDLEQEFAGQFLRIHRSTLVALTQITSLSRENNRTYLRLKDVSKPLEVSRRHVQKVKQILRDMRLPCTI